LGEHGRVSVRALPARPAQHGRVGPYLLPSLAQEALSGEPADRAQQPVEQRGWPGQPDQLVLLGRDPGGEHLIDRPVVGLPAGQQRRVVELIIADHRHQGLRQVVVDVRVHAEQHMPERGQAGRGAERDHPGPRQPAARLAPFQGVQVQVGEHDVPSLDPRGVGESAAADFPRHRDGGAQVRRVEVEPLVARALQRLKQRLHAGDQLIDHASTLIDSPRHWPSR
jgi:hypothetical protein